MKKTIVLPVLLLVLALAFTGCKKAEEPENSKQNFILDSLEDSIAITCDEAGRGTGGVGYLSFGEGDDLNYQLNGENGEELLHVYIFHKEEPENPLSYTQTDSDSVYLDFTVQNGTGGMIGMEPGDYAFLIEVESTEFNGTATFEVVTDEFGTGLANPWKDAGSAEEVADALGFDFEIPEEFNGMHPSFFSYAPDLMIANADYAETMADGTEYLKGCIRKTVKHMYDPEGGSLSGVWDEYDEIKEEESATFCLNDGLVRVVDWDTDNFHYSLWTQDGMNIDQVRTIMDMIL